MVEPKFKFGGKVKNKLESKLIKNMLVDIKKKLYNIVIVNIIYCLYIEDPCLRLDFFTILTNY